MAVPMKAGEILAPWLQQSGVQHHLRERRLHTEWAMIAGHLVATHSRPLRLRRQQLTIAAESPAWLHQLRYLEPMLLAQVQRAFGPDLVTELRWVVGPVIDVTSTSLQVASTQPEEPLTPETDTLIRDAVALLSDPAVAEAAHRLLRKALSRLPGIPNP
jgi:predicted nucleic acid-binding Zn ribbon protein